MQLMPVALAFALARAGSSMPARIAMMAITTSSSISVKPRSCRLARRIVQASGVASAPSLPQQALHLSMTLAKTRPTSAQPTICSPICLPM